MKLAFDIGCNIGKTSDFLLPSYDKIICFEPNPNLVEQLKNKYQNNNKIIISFVCSNSSYYLVSMFLRMIFLFYIFATPTNEVDF